MSRQGLPDFSRARVLVVGDVMLDRYWFGDVNRISPEAPVPVVRIGRMEERPGGAANVARNAAALGAQVDLLAVVGEDDPGAGYGGSCFPKDVSALIRTAEDCGVDLKVVRAVRDANDRQKGVVAEKIVRRFGDGLAGRRFAIWGLAFKPNTDDMREAPSRVVLDALMRRGASVCAYDPVAMDEARKIYQGVHAVSFAGSAMEAAQGADALVIMTEWKAFRSPDFDALRKALRQPVIFDGRNLYDPATVRGAGLEYHGVGRGAGS